MAAADMHDTFVTPTQWMDWATQEHRALTISLAQSSWTQNLLTTTVTIDSADLGLIPIPEPLAVVCVHHAGPQGTRPLTHTNAVDLLRLVNPSAPEGNASHFGVTYDPDASQYTVRLVPQPRSGDQYTITYVPLPKTLVLGTPGAGEANSVGYPLGFEERIVLGMARRALIKEESDTMALERLIKEEDARIERAIWGFVMSQVPTIRNVDRQARNWTSTLIYPPSRDWVWL
jgi:hypothetical protein